MGEPKRSDFLAPFVPQATPDLAALWTDAIVSFLRKHVEVAHADGVILGMSGGLDSAVVGALAVRALGPDRVHALIMPSHEQNAQDTDHGQLMVDHLGIASHLVPIGPIVETLETQLHESLPDHARANAKARARMMVLYAEGQRQNLLVAGTGNKSELLVGYFTKHGDGGNDLQPIGDLYKTQVRELARYLGVPGAIIEKPPSAGLRPGQTDEEDLGMSYETLDRILYGIELNQDLERICEKTGEAQETVHLVSEMVRRSEHKRQMSLIPKLGSRTVGIDWRRAVHWEGP